MSPTSTDDQVRRIHGQGTLYKNGVEVGWLKKRTGGAGYVLEVYGWYWRRGVPNQHRGGNCGLLVKSVAAGMQVVTDLLAVKPQT